MNKFEMLIQELGQILGISLEAEQGSLCKMFIKEKVHLQIEYDEEFERIILACFVCEVPPGKFREDTLTAALKANYIDSSLGSFSYVESTQTLILQLYLPSSVAAPLLGTLLQQFTEKAIDWKEAIEHGNVSGLVPSVGSSLPSPMNLS
ncbi:MAG: hypothetical protein V4489_07100 [Chlamydiota bacterium]